MPVAADLIPQGILFVRLAAKSVPGHDYQTSRAVQDSDVCLRQCHAARIFRSSISTVSTEIVGRKRDHDDGIPSTHQASASTPAWRDIPGPCALHCFEACKIAYLPLHLTLLLGAIQYDIRHNFWARMLPTHLGPYRRHTPQVCPGEVPDPPLPARRTPGWLNTGFRTQQLHPAIFSSGRPADPSQGKQQVSITASSIQGKSTEAQRRSATMNVRDGKPPRRVDRILPAQLRQAWAGQHRTIRFDEPISLGPCAHAADGPALWSVQTCQKI